MRNEFNDYIDIYNEAANANSNIYYDKFFCLFSLSLSVSHSFCLSVFLCLCLSVPLSFSVSLSLSLSLFLYLLPSFSVSRSFLLFTALPVCQFFSGIKKQHYFKLQFPANAQNSIGYLFVISFFTQAGNLTLNLKCSSCINFNYCTLRNVMEATVKNLKGKIGGDFLAITWNFFFVNASLSLGLFGMSSVSISSLLSRCQCLYLSLYVFLFLYFSLPLSFYYFSLYMSPTMCYKFFEYGWPGAHRLKGRVTQIFPKIIGGRGPWIVNKIKRYTLTPWLHLRLVSVALKFQAFETWLRLG